MGGDARIVQHKAEGGGIGFAVPDFVRIIHFVEKALLEIAHPVGAEQVVVHPSDVRGVGVAQHEKAVARAQCGEGAEAVGGQAQQHGVPRFAEGRIGEGAVGGGAQRLKKGRFGDLARFVTLEKPVLHMGAAGRFKGRVIRHECAEGVCGGRYVQIEDDVAEIKEDVFDALVSLHCLSCNVGKWWGEGNAENSGLEISSMFANMTRVLPKWSRRVYWCSPKEIFDSYWKFLLKIYLLRLESRLKII